MRTDYGLVAYGTCIQPLKTKLHSLVSTHNQSVRERERER
eukprot:COSAG05_NODE_4747_length_1387_cov_3.580081_1_plen_39_part_10